MFLSLAVTVIYRIRASEKSDSLLIGCHRISSLARSWRGEEVRGEHAGQPVLVLAGLPAAVGGQVEEHPGPGQRPAGVGSRCRIAPGREQARVGQVGDERADADFGDEVLKLA
jgi:hypothetical protein